MTIAVDVKSGRVLGQVIPGTPAIPMRKDIPKDVLRLFGKDGYFYVPVSSVRIEDV